MITIIDGAKGTGKTKKIIDAANAVVSKGDMVFISTTDRYRTEIKPQIKFINAEEEKIDDKKILFGFIKGMLSANYDIDNIYIDGVYKIMNVGADSPEMADFFKFLEEISKSAKVSFTLTMSCEREKLPAFIAKYVK
jgi:hypothetical protein